MTRFVIIAEFRDGSAAYLRGRVTDDGRRFTTSRRWAWKLPAEDADEVASRLNRVAAEGHYWRGVAFFRAAPFSSTPRRDKRCHTKSRYAKTV